MDDNLLRVTVFLFYLPYEGVCVSLPSPRTPFPLTMNAVAYTPSPLERTSLWEFYFFTSQFLFFYSFAYSVEIKPFFPLYILPTSLFPFLLAQEPQFCLPWIMATIRPLACCA